MQLRAVLTVPIFLLVDYVDQLCVPDYIKCINRFLVFLGLLNLQNREIYTVLYQRSQRSSAPSKKRHNVVDGQ